ncbi:MAG: hypothetical protein JST79_17010 [Acidobacteria bacterium]|nr:hypothetical protein [Acidobacteriota bacterium]
MPSTGECIPFPEARNHVGETRCVTGKVFRVQRGNRGVHYLDFCEDYRVCPFTVVVFPRDLRQVGDIRQLQGRMVEIHGAIKLYDGRAEIVLRLFQQLSGEAASIPALPKNYDVEKKGRYNAGRFSYATPSHSSNRKRQTPTLTQVPKDADATFSPSEETGPDR